MIHGSLFSGWGGFDLAAEWMGWKNAFHCEIDPTAQRVLKYHFPKAKSYDNIKHTNFNVWRGRIDVLTGGFPCQPFSLGGKREGTNDNRYLWPEMLRAIKQVKPTYIVAENVFGLISQQNGLVFEKVCAQMENEGYQVQPVIIPAASVNAPHKRDRVWFIAYTNTNGSRRNTRAFSAKVRCKLQKWSKQNPQRKPLQQLNKSSEIWRVNSNTHFKRGRKRHHQTKPQQPKRPRFNSISQKLPYTNGCFFRFKTWPQPQSPKRIGPQAQQQPKGFGDLPQWDQFPTQPPLCSRNDGLSTQLFGITFPKWRKEAIKGMGNAIVPQVAKQIFDVIEQLEKANSTTKQ